MAARCENRVRDALCVQEWYEVHPPFRGTREQRAEDRHDRQQTNGGISRIALHGEVLPAVSLEDLARFGRDSESNTVARA